MPAAPLEPDSDPSAHNSSRSQSTELDDLPHTVTPVPDPAQHSPRVGLAGRASDDHTAAATHIEGDGKDAPQQEQSRCSRFWHKLAKVLEREFVPIGIDQKMFLPLLLVLLCEGITSTSITSYVGFMIVDLGAASTTDDVGS